MRDENKLGFESGKYYCVEARKLVDISYSPYSQQFRERKSKFYQKKSVVFLLVEKFFTVVINRFRFLIQKAYEKKSKTDYFLP